jgi:hypothetical protein
VTLYEFNNSVTDDIFQLKSVPSYYQLMFDEAKIAGQSVKLKEDAVWILNEKLNLLAFKQ